MSTVNGSALVGWPQTLTMRSPVVAVMGTDARMLVSDHVVTAAATPLKFTVLEPCVAPNPVPKMVTESPRRAEAGAAMVSVGGGIRVNVLVLLDWPDMVTTTSLVLDVAPCGTGT